MSDHFDPKGAWWVARPENEDKLFYGLVTVCVLLVISDFMYHHFVHAKHGYFTFETAIGFHAAYGGMAFLFVVMVGTKLRGLLQRPEDYYDVPYTPPPDDHHGHHDHDHNEHESHGHEPEDLEAEDHDHSHAKEDAAEEVTAQEGEADHA
jgi:hypothetical protein